MKLFIVEDSAIIRGRIMAMVSILDNIQIAGSSGETVESLNMIRTLQPDIVILDIRLKGGSGIDLLQVIKNEFPGILVIMLTNYPYPQYQRRCLELGADYFFDKSREFEKIIDVLNLTSPDGIGISENI